MILKSLTLNNFLAYFGEQTITMPDTKNSSLTVIVGPNNGGKTSVIRALKFFLYGESSLPAGHKVREYVSNRLLEDTPEGGTAVAWVEVVIKHRFDSDTTEKKFRRQIEMKRASEDTWQKPSVTLFDVQFNGVGKPPKLVPDADGAWQRALRRLVPEALFDAFYFRGEPLDGKLLADVGNIRDALGLFLHENEWQQAESAANKVAERLERKLGELSAHAIQLRQAMERQTSLQTTLREIEQSREEILTEVAQLTQEKVVVDASYDKLENYDADGANRERTAAERARAEAMSRVASLDNAIHQSIGASLGLPFLKGAVSKVADMLSNMQQENILPADITEGFVDRVLTHPTCVCGRPHDDQTRENWGRYKAKALAVDASDGLRKLLDWVNPSGTWSIAQRGNRVRTELHGLLQDRKAAVESRHQADARYDEASRKLDLIPLNEIKALNKKRDQLTADIANRTKNIPVIERRIEQVKRDLAEIKAVVTTEQTKAGIAGGEFEALKAAKARAYDLASVLRRCRSRLSEHFRESLQKSLSESYDRHATDGSNAIIDARTLRPSISVNGKIGNVLGGGQSQLLALCYVVALARLRQQMHQWMETLGAKLGHVDDLSFFMDSPLGHMEDHYKRAAVSMIPGSAKQVTVLLWKGEWEYVRPQYGENAAAIHAIRFHTRMEDVRKISEPDRIYDFPNQTEELIVALPEGETQPRSEFLRIK
jgi:DNA sulfur modification protein DndD